MVQGIATSLNGLQKATAQANAAAQAIASYPAQIANPQDSVDVSTGASIPAASLAQGSLETSVVVMKVAAQMYKANAEALNAQLEMQRDMLERLI